MKMNSLKTHFYFSLANECHYSLFTIRLRIKIEYQKKTQINMVTIKKMQTTIPLYSFAQREIVLRTKAKSVIN